MQFIQFCAVLSEETKGLTQLLLCMQQSGRSLNRLTSKHLCVKNKHAWPQEKLIFVNSNSAREYVLFVLCLWVHACEHIVGTWSILRIDVLWNPCTLPCQCMSVGALAYIRGSYSALVVCVCVCVWFDQRALTHGCPSGNQICHVAEHGHQVAMLSGSALPRRSPGRYPRNTLERRGGAADGGQAATH